jgi:hypothetical protein
VGGKFAIELGKQRDAVGEAKLGARGGERGVFRRRRAVDDEACARKRLEYRGDKLAALVVLGKYLGMFDERPQNTNAVYAISDEPMSAEEWKKQYVKEG